MKVELLIIDPQYDFCNPNGALFVNGADQDMIRLAAMITRIYHKLDDIHVTLDSHHLVDIAHPIFWMDSNGKHPIPFENGLPVMITAKDVSDGIYRTTKPQHQSRATDYVNQLETNGRYPLTIWPPHCLIGSMGGIVVPELYEALTLWEQSFAMVDYVTKGSNFWTEHYSAVQADVPDPNDPGTQLRTDDESLIGILPNADIIGLAGEARSHCLANTVTDIANKFGEDNIKKMVLLTDATSDVTGCESMGEDFVNAMVARGMQLSTTEEFLR